MPSESEKSLLQELLTNTVSHGERHAYGEEPQQFVETYGNPATCHTVILYIHGGYFRDRIDLTHARPAAEALASERAFVILLEYRRTGGGGGHPRTLEDITAAIAYCEASFADWGIPAEVAAQPVVTGHSAGACLALAWATHQPDRDRPTRLVALSPITDLVREVEMEPAEGAVLAYMGMDFREDPAPYLWEDPRSRIALLPETFIVLSVHGSADEVVNIEFSRQFPAPLQEIPGANHFDLIDPNSSYFPVIVEALLRG